MVNADLSIVRSISILQKQEKEKGMREFYTMLEGEVKTGRPLSEVLASSNFGFTDAESAMLEAGERTGRLNAALLQLADQVEKIQGISSKLKGALIYPSAIVIVMLAATGLLMTVVVPKLTEMLGDPEKFPTSTKILLAISAFLQSSWHVIILAIITVLVLLKIWRNTESGAYKFASIMLHIPIFGNIIRKVVLSKFSRALSGLLSSGISIVESLRIVSEVVDNEVYRQRILLLRRDVKQGMKIAEGLEDDSLFPDMLIQMIRVGEETAKLDTVILKVAAFYEEEVDAVVGNMNKIIEPIIIVTMAVLIGGVALGVMQPIMALSDTIQ